VSNESHDKVFFKNFSLVMGGLFAIFFICITVARFITPEPGLDAAAAARIDERIKPIGEVVTDPAALQLKLATNKPVRAPYTGEQLVAKVCSACHLSGMLGAPKIGDKADWGKRKGSNGGLDGLVKLAIKGINQMPARGGDPDLSDEEIKAAVEYMLSK
jgi:cytochrome c5